MLQITFHSFCVSRLFDGAMFYNKILNDIPHPTSGSINISLVANPTFKKPFIYLLDDDQAEPGLQCHQLTQSGHASIKCFYFIKSNLFRKGQKAQKKYKVELDTSLVTPPPPPPRPSLPL